jgi:hypothetical protein
MTNTLSPHIAARLEYGIGDRQWSGEMPSLRCVRVEDLSGEPKPA